MIVIPRSPGGWWHEYVCPTHGVELGQVGLLGGSFPAEGAPCRHGCRWDTPAIRGAWTVLAHQACAVAAEEATLLSYEEFYLSLDVPMFRQPLTEAVWAVSIGVAARRHGNPVPSLMRALARNAEAAREGIDPRSNYIAWFNAAGAVCEGGEKWQRWQAEHVLAATYEDGWEWEGSTYYHAFVLRAYELSLSEPPPAVQKRLAAMREVAAAFADTALHDGPYCEPGHIPPPHASAPLGAEPSGVAFPPRSRALGQRATPVDHELRSVITGEESGDVRERGIKDVAAATCLMPGSESVPPASAPLSSKPPASALPASALPACALPACAPRSSALITRFETRHAAENAPKSMINAWRGVGYGVVWYEGIRGIVDFGPHGGSHGHRDKLALYLYPWQPDPGQVPYGHKGWREYYASTRAHPTFRIDDLEQAECSGYQIAEDTFGCDDAYEGVRAIRKVTPIEGGLRDELTIACDRPRKVTLQLRPAVPLEIDGMTTRWLGERTLTGTHECDAESEFMVLPGPGPADDPQRTMRHVDWSVYGATRVTFRSEYRCLS